MGKKIAIFTQPLGHNYGGIIQNYALQQVLIKLGHHPLTINRTYTEHKYSFFELIKVELAHKIKYRDRLPIIPRVVNRVFKNTISFIKHHITITEKLDSNTNLKAYMEHHTFDVYLVGSDQTWRPRYSPHIPTYFLDFLDGKKAKRIAYASSFGTDEWEYSDEQHKICKPLAQQFDAISVREDSGVKLCKDYFEVDATHVLDPTLLLSAEEYNKAINRPKENKSLFTYVLDQSAEKQDFIKTCSNHLQLTVTRNQTDFNIYKQDSNKLKDYILPPLEGWLQGFRDAEFVITDSFHGTVFSIINQKPFIAIANKERGASRFTSLLSALGLEDRLVFDVATMDNNLLNQPIDYVAVNKKLEDLKQHSLDFLIKALEK